MVYATSALGLWAPTYIWIAERRTTKKEALQTLLTCVDSNHDGMHSLHIICSSCRAYICTLHSLCRIWRDSGSHVKSGRFFEWVRVQIGMTHPFSFSGWFNRIGCWCHNSECWCHYSASWCRKSGWKRLLMSLKWRFSVKFTENEIISQECVSKWCMVDCSRCAFELTRTDTVFPKTTVPTLCQSLFSLLCLSTFSES